MPFLIRPHFVLSAFSPFPLPRLSPILPSSLSLFLFFLYWHTPHMLYCVGPFLLSFLFYSPILATVRRLAAPEFIYRPHSRRRFFTLFADVASRLQAILKYIKKTPKGKVGGCKEIQGEGAWEINR